MKKIFPIIASLVLAASSSAFADATPGHYWTYQQVTDVSLYPYSVALGMRTGDAWPVVFAPAINSTNSVNAFTPFPSNPNWSIVGTFTQNPMSENYWHLRAETSSTGRVAFLGTDWNGKGVIGSVSGTNGGWTALSSDTRAIAFDSSGNLFCATASGISGFSAFPTYSGNIAAMSVSKSGDIGLVTSTLDYMEYSSWRNTWKVRRLGTGTSFDSADIIFDSKNRPHIVTQYGPTIMAYDYDVILNAWTENLLTNNARIPSDQTVTLAASDDGTIGIALAVDNAGLVYYSKDDINAWTSELVLATNELRNAALEYDYNGLPLIAYATYTGVYLAYDPISAVPEPATMSVLLIGGSVLLLKRKR